MTFEQARELSFLVKWKVIECFSGPDCWCRKIVPVDPIHYNEEIENFGKTFVSKENEKYEIIPDGSVDKDTAEYIVKLHNENYDRVQQGCREMMKELTDSIIPLYEDVEPIRTIYRKEID